MSTHAAIEPARNDAFVTEFLDAYLTPSFGALTKREADILVFTLLYKHGAFGARPDIQQVSRILRLNPARVRGYLRDMDLRDTTIDEAWFAREVKQLLAVVKVDADGRHIILGVERDSLRAEIVERIKRLGSTPEFGNNRELLQIDFATFGAFIASFASPEEIDRLRQGFLGADGKAKLKPGELVTQLVGDALKKAVGDAASDVLKDNVAKPVIDWCGGVVTDLLKSWK
jgi:hypothetical protein